MNIFPNLFNFQKPDKDLCLLIDIGNSSVRGGLVLFEKNKKPKVLYTKSLPILMDQKPKTEDIEDLTLKYTDEILLHLIKENPNKIHKHPERILCTLSSPWFFSKNKEIIVENKNDFYITERFIYDVLEKESESYKKELGGQSHIEVIEKVVVNTKINGYEINKPIGMKTKNAHFNLYLSVAPLSFIKNLEKKFYTHTHIDSKHIIYHSFPLVCKEAIGQILGNDHDYGHIDMTGEVTDLTIISNGLVEHTISLPFGKNTIIRQIAKELDLPYSVAIGTLHSYQMKILDEKTNEIVRDILSRLEKECHIYLEEGLSSATPKMFLPKNVFITTENDVSELCKEFIKNTTFNPEVSGQNHINPIIIESSIFKDNIDYDKNAIFNTYVSIESIFLSKFHIN